MDADGTRIDVRFASAARLICERHNEAMLPLVAWRLLALSGLALAAIAFGVGLVHAQFG